MYNLSTNPLEVAEDMKERGADAIIDDAADELDAFLHIAQAFEQVGKYFTDYLDYLFEHNKIKYQDEYDVAILWKENQELLRNFAQFFQSGNFVFTDMIYAHKMSLEIISHAFYKTKIDWAAKSDEKTC